MEAIISTTKTINISKNGDTTKAITEILGLSQEDARMLVKASKRGQIVKIHIPIECVLKNIRRQLLKKNVNIQITTNDEKV